MNMWFLYRPFPGMQLVFISRNISQIDVKTKDVQVASRLSGRKEERVEDVSHNASLCGGLMIAYQLKRCRLGYACQTRIRGTRKSKVHTWKRLLRIEPLALLTPIWIEWDFDMYA